MSNFEVIFDIFIFGVIGLKKFKLLKLKISLFEAIKTKLQIKSPKVEFF